MSKLNHTPGKWHYVDYAPQFNGCFPVYDIRDDNGTCVAEVVHTESDARLMTASPDMLDALIEEKKKRKEKCPECHHSCTGFSKECLVMKHKTLIESATGLPIEEVLK